MRRTKIVATVGPASDSETVLSALIAAGVDVFRLNFSHGSEEEHRQRASLLRSLAAEQNRYIGLLGDLQGPKIRLRQLRNGSVALSKGGTITLDTSLADGEGDDSVIGVDYEPLASAVSPGDTLLLDDGRYRLTVLDVESDSRVRCRSESNGTLLSRKGINRLGGGLSAPALTDKDLVDIKLAAGMNLDYIAVSFPGSAADIQTAREHIRNAGIDASIIGKIERAEAVADEHHLDQLIEACDGVMVARGDLGVEIGDANLIAYQKRIIKRTRQLNRVVITATQMMESMIASPVPTRAEVFDVANAVLDGTDAVMLSAETATGEYPVETVKAMADTCVGAEQSPSIRRSGHRMERTFDNVEEAIAMGAMYTANHMEDVQAIVSLTESGRTALLMSRISSGLPIYAMSRHEATCNKLTLYRGVKPIHFNVTDLPDGEVVPAALRELRRRGLLNSGDQILVTRGDSLGIGGRTNSLKILTL